MKVPASIFSLSSNKFQLISNCFVLTVIPSEIQNGLPGASWRLWGKRWWRQPGSLNQHSCPNLCGISVNVQPGALELQEMEAGNHRRPLTGSSAPPRPGAQCKVLATERNLEAYTPKLKERELRWWDNNFIRHMCIWRGEETIPAFKSEVNSLRASLGWAYLEIVHLPQRHRQSLCTLISKSTHLGQNNKERARPNPASDRWLIVHQQPVSLFAPVSTFVIEKEKF